jgi:hypothetical protein
MLAAVEKVMLDSMMTLFVWINNGWYLPQKNEGNAAMMDPMMCRRNCVLP